MSDWVAPLSDSEADQIVAYITNAIKEAGKSNFVANDGEAVMRAAVKTLFGRRWLDDVLVVKFVVI